VVIAVLIRTFVIWNKRKQDQAAGNAEKVLSPGKTSSDMHADSYNRLEQCGLDDFVPAVSENLLSLCIFPWWPGVDHRFLNTPKIPDTQFVAARKEITPC
jgi:hypothetical protein